MRRALPGGAPEGPTTRHQWQRCPTWRGPHYRYIRSPADSARKLPDLIRGTAHDMTLELLVDDSFQQRRRIVERKHVGPAGMTSGSDLHHDQIYEARTWPASAIGGEIGTRSHSVRTSSIFIRSVEAGTRASRTSGSSPSKLRASSGRLPPESFPARC